MIKVKFGLKIILGFYLIVSLIGCGLADRVLHEDKYHDYYSRQQEAEKRKLVEKHQQALGMLREEMQRKYGKPEDIEYNAKHFTGEYDPIKKEWVYENFDERWYYRFHTGIKYISGNLWGVYFYFEDNKVVKVDTR
jgi:hypothetical protein